jgi:peptidoglycan/xylan/chitin deacetylase (PgdA/CDA1 family)
MDQLTPQQNREEVVHNEKVLAAAGAPIAFKGIRPPFGGSNPAVQKLLIEMGYTYYLNRIDGADWLPDKSAAAIRDDIVAKLRPGVIIGMHDGPIDTPAGAATVDAVGQIIDEARDLGYCFGVVDVSGQVVADRYVSHGAPIPPVTAPVPYRLPLAFGTEDQIPQPWTPIR